eukprot:GHVQ01029588.1.p2 GENE.GHVQ01029588.1~~GHVQ01029588.1.p2  ORF type:complete len:111 (+),score=11.22 GHVQ01029588.1:829-1161(+)
MSEQVRLRLVFPNHVGITEDIICYTDMLISDVKKTVLSDHWRSDFGHIDDVARIRIFYAGKELDDSMSLSGNHIISCESYPTAVHVFIVNKIIKGGAEPLRPSLCMCCIS